MKTQLQIIRELKKSGMHLMAGMKDKIDALSGLITKEEKIISGSYPFLESIPGILVVTNRQLIFQYRKKNKLTHRIFPVNAITVCYRKNDAKGHLLHLICGGEKLRFYDVCDHCMLTVVSMIVPEKVSDN